MTEDEYVWYMRYRDERDALRDRVGNLEADLADARKEIAEHCDDNRQARVAELESKVAQLRGMLSEVERELVEVRGAKAPPRSRRAPIVAAASVGVLVIGGGALLLAGSSAAPPPPMPPPTPTPFEEVQVAPPPEAPAPAPAPEPPAVPKPAPRSVVATWTARVLTATGTPPVKRGAACTIEAKLSEDGVRIDVGGVVTKCGDTLVFDSAVKLEGMSSTVRGADEQIASTGAHQYKLRFDDIGPRTGKPEVSFNSETRSASIWSETEPSYRIKLEVETWSEPVAGDPMLVRTKESLLLTPVVTKVTGPAPARKGDSCILRSTPLASRDCVSVLECNGRAVYGGPGLGVSSCVVSDGRVSIVEDNTTTAEDHGDPIFDLDIVHGMGVVRDARNGNPWTIELDLKTERSPKEAAKP